jgi:hypothetical protein
VLDRRYRVRRTQAQASAQKMAAGQAA